MEIYIWLDLKFYYEKLIQAYLWYLGYSHFSCCGNGLRCFFHTVGDGKFRHNRQAVGHRQTVLYTQPEGPHWGHQVLSYTHIVCRLCQDDSKIVYLKLRSMLRFSVKVVNKTASKHLCNLCESFQLNICVKIFS